MPRLNENERATKRNNGMRGNCCSAAPIPLRPAAHPRKSVQVSIDGVSALQGQAPAKIAPEAPQAADQAKGQLMYLTGRFGFDDPSTGRILHAASTVRVRALRRPIGDFATRRELAECVVALFTRPTWEQARVRRLNRDEWGRSVWRPTLYGFGMFRAAHRHGWDSPEVREANRLYAGLLGGAPWPVVQS